MGQISVPEEVIIEMTSAAGLDVEFARSFIDRISKDQSLLEEFVIYITERRFTCENKVKGYSVVDILIWQMDHFRAYMDRGLYGMKDNECEMLLKAFDTFMNMKEDPEKYFRLMTEETGSDYEGKFN